MQVRVCPKCKVENKPENATCSGCYASLDGVTPTESQNLSPPVAQPRPPERVPPAAGAPRQQQPPSSHVPPSEQASPYGPPPVGAYGPQVRPTAEPVKQGSSVGVIILLLIIIGGGAFAGWWFLIKAPTPEQVVQGFFDAAKAGDLEGMKAHLTEAGIRELKNLPGGEKQAAEDMKKAVAQGGDANWDIKVGEAVYEGDDKAFVGIEPVQKPEQGAGFNIDIKVEFVLLREGGRWKIDLDETEKRLMQQMQESFQNMPKSLPKVPDTGG